VAVGFHRWGERRFVSHIKEQGMVAKKERGEPECKGEVINRSGCEKRREGNGERG
jgi:hypothetical protein